MAVNEVILLKELADGSFSADLTGAKMPAIDGSALTGIAPGGAPASNFVYRPGGVQTGNVFTDFSDMMAAIALVDGVKTIFWDAVTLALGATIIVNEAVINLDFEGVIFQSSVIKIDALASTSPQAVSFPDGTTITNWPTRIDSTQLIFNNTSVPVSTCSASQTCIITLFRGHLINDGSEPIVEITGASAVPVLHGYNARLASSNGPIFELGAFASFLLTNLHNNSIADGSNLISGSGSAFWQSSLDSSSSFDATQPGFTGSSDQIFLSIADTIDVDESSWSNIVGANLQLSLNSIDGQLGVPVIQKYTVITWRPGGTLLENIVTTDAELTTKLNEVGSHVIVFLDPSVSTVFTITTAIPNAERIKFIGVGRRDIIQMTLDDSATMNMPLHLENMTFILNRTAAAVTWLASHACTLVNAKVTNSNIPLQNLITGAGTRHLYMFGESELQANSVNVATPAVLNIKMYDNSSIPGGLAITGNGTLDILHVNTAIYNVQSAFTGSLSDTQLGSKPVSDYFRARKTSVQTIAAATLTQEDIVFQADDFSNSDFTPSTGVYIIPKTGIYEFYLQISILAGGSGVDLKSIKSRILLDGVAMAEQSDNLTTLAANATTVITIHTGPKGLSAASAVKATFQHLTAPSENSQLTAGVGATFFWGRRLGDA